MLIFATFASQTTRNLLEKNQNRDCLFLTVLFRLTIRCRSIRSGCVQLFATCIRSQ